jgi:sorting nexin-19
VKYDGQFTPFINFESTFHNLQPHPALLSPETEADYLRLIADGCLAVLLPTEDLASACERSLVREILASLILRKGLDLMSEPYMLYEMSSNVIRISQEKSATTGTEEPLSARIWGVINYFNPYARTPGPPRGEDDSRPRRQAITQMSIFKLFSEILSYTNRQTVLIRQISAVLPLLIHGPIRIFLQKSPPSTLVADGSLLSMKLRTHVFQERTITTALRATRDALWPGGIMNPPRIPPTPSEAAEIRRTAEKNALNALPGTPPRSRFPLHELME